jgi:hypothetical protein
MKNLIFISAIPALMLFSNCKKHDASTGEVKEIAATVNNNETYTLDLGASDFSIAKQASNFSSSALTADQASGNLIYNYTPASGFQGTDEVNISSGQAASCEHHGGHHGCGNHHSCGGKEHHKCGHSCGGKGLTYHIKLTVVQAK